MNVMKKADVVAALGTIGFVAPPGVNPAYVVVVENPEVPGLEFRVRNTTVRAEGTRGGQFRAKDLTDFDTVKDVVAYAKRAIARHKKLEAEREARAAEQVENFNRTKPLIEAAVEETGLPETAYDLEWEDSYDCACAEFTYGGFELFISADRLTVELELGWKGSRNLTLKEAVKVIDLLNQMGK